MASQWHWINRPLGIDQKFTFGDASTLPYEPMEYIGRQVQGDFSIQDQRDNQLWMDAGIITSQADWSLDFDIGMNFFEWHGPVPLAHEAGVFERALKFLLNLQIGRPVRRLNWTMTINPRLDTSPENYHKWGRDRTTVTPENVGRESASARRDAGPFQAAPIERDPVLDPRLSDEPRADRHGAEMGPPPAARSENTAAGTRRIQERSAAIAHDAIDVAFEIRRRRADLARRRSGLSTPHQRNCTQTIRKTAKR